MRKSPVSLVSVALAVLLAGAVVLAQTHSNTVEKKASDEIRFTTDVMVGTQLLKAGRYQVSCDTKTIKFSKIEVGPGIFTTATKVLEVPCQGKEVAERHKHTEFSIPLNKDNVAVLEKLNLRGSNIEHVFPN
jgi:hypothetical protein